MKTIIREMKIGNEEIIGEKRKQKKQQEMKKIIREMKTKAKKK